MHDYDVALKLLLQSFASMTIQQVAGGAITKWLNVELPELRNTRVDLLGETSAGELVHIELQSGNDAKMALRMAEYCLRVYRLFNALPRQILLYVGADPVSMNCELSGPDLSFRYRIVDVREFDGDRLVESDAVGDNVIAILARLRDRGEAVRRIVGKIAALEAADRETALKALMLLAGLRSLEDVVEEEVSKVPVLNDILENRVLGREYNRGREEGREEGVDEEALAFLCRLIRKRFGSVPDGLEQRLASRSKSELEELGERLLDIRSLEELWSAVNAHC
ncbi:MAG TPA: DUF4351 domain-containing protein [Bryobacteraceae bacterium]|nr:DUF4351 domain-containing protein [Bryobacteraceae bacterium]